MTDAQPADGLAPEDDSSPGLDRFGLLLAVTLATIAVLSLVDVGRAFDDVRGTLGALLVSVSAPATIILAYRAAGAAPRVRRVMGIVATVSAVLLVLVIVLQAAGTDTADVGGGGTPLYWFLLSAIAPVAVVRRLLQHRAVGMQTLYGALAGYLLIAVSFNYGFQTIGALQDTPFFGVEVPTTDFMYFSIVTITTVGYGGQEAVTALGRLASGAEAILGQVYLVTVVAMIVGLLAQERS